VTKEIWQSITLHDAEAGPKTILIIHYASAIWQ
jgi:hypothetical protein